MKIRVELEMSLDSNFVNINNREEIDWLFNHIRTNSKLYLHDKEMEDTIGNVARVLKCEELD